MKVCRTTLLPVLLLTFASGCSIAIKGGAQTFTNSDFEDLRNPPFLDVWELEFGVREWKEGKVDLAVGLSIVDSVPGTDWNEIRVTSRYHFRRGKRVEPFVGGGIGWYRLFAKELIVITSDCIAPDIFCPQLQFEEDDTLASGFYPGLSFGLNFPVSNAASLVLEDRFDFLREDKGVDLNSNQILFGARFRLR